MLRRVRGEEHLLLRQYFPRGNCTDTAICTYSLPLLAALSRRGPHTHIYPFVQRGLNVEPTHIWNARGRRIERHDKGVSELMGSRATAS